MPTVTENLKAFQSVNTDMFQKDFLLTWEHPEQEIKAILALADAFKGLHKEGKSYKSFDTGLAISIFRDNSTRTRFSSPPPPTPWAWASPTWTSRRARSPTARLSARPPT